MTLNYYTTITLISLAALMVLCVLVRENGRIRKKQKISFYLTYLFIGVAAIAEWVGIQLNGNTDIPAWLLVAVKCADYIMTPMAGGALVMQINIRNRGNTVLNSVLVANTAFQVISAFFGWMTIIDESHRYSHGPLYFIYILVYLTVIAIVIIEFLIYGKNFSRQNRYSLYSAMALVLAGILTQELLGGEFRTAYISLTFGAAMLFIHYTEYAQLNAEAHISRQNDLLYREPMTGLLSRYAYTQKLKEFDEKGSLPHDLAVFSIDINNLKHTNDTLGHAAGDELICGAAECIHRVFSTLGLCYRTGGDEYIVLAYADKGQAKNFVRKLYEEAEAWSGKIIQYISLSVGYALASDHPDVTAEKLIIFADQEMYKDKNNYYRRSRIDRHYN